MRKLSVDLRKWTRGASAPTTICLMSVQVEQSMNAAALCGCAPVPQTHPKASALREVKRLCVATDGTGTPDAGHHHHPVHHLADIRPMVEPPQPHAGSPLPRAAAVPPPQDSSSGLLTAGLQAALVAVPPPTSTSLQQSSQQQQLQLQPCVGHPEIIKALASARQKWQCVAEFHEQFQGVFFERREAAAAAAACDAAHEMPLVGAGVAPSGPSPTPAPLLLLGPSSRHVRGTAAEGAALSLLRQTEQQGSAPSRPLVATHPAARRRSSSPEASAAAAAPGAGAAALAAGRVPCRPPLPEHLSRFSADLSSFVRWRGLSCLAALRYGDAALSSSGMVCSLAFGRDDELFAVAGVSPTGHYRRGGRPHSCAGAPAPGQSRCQRQRTRRRGGVPFSGLTYGRS